MRAERDPGEIRPMPEGEYPLPRILPPGRHPRVLIAEGEIELLRAKREQPVYAAAVREWKKLLEMNPAELLNPENTRNGMALAHLEAKAFSYCLDGARTDGLDAVAGIIRFLRKASFDGLSDDYRFMGHAMFTAAEVYDWCHDLLSEEDRYQIVATIENQIAPRMEIGMPPCRYGVLVGHQAEAQLLRDWLTFSIAVYDEYPDIYRFVAGRFFSKFVPVRNYWYRTGSTVNGSSYGGYRFTWDLWSEWIFRKMSGDSVYVPEMKTLPAQWLHFRRPDGQGLRDGDDYAEFGGRWDQYGYAWFYAGNLFRDPVYRKQAFQKLGNRDRFTYTELTLTPVQMLLFDDDSIGEADFEDSYPLVRHYPEPCGVTMARTGYDISPDSRDVIALMKIGGLWTANHHHMDFGHFQLYYRGILASDSGAYIRYGSPQDMNYNKQTVAHNCILIYKPGETNGPAVNSGGQIMAPGEVKDLDHWLADPRFRMAYVLGHDENPAATYIAGDLTPAYGEKAKHVLRRMVFLPQKDPEIPAVMMVYDHVVAADASYRKTSLLHCQEEPEVRGNRIVIRRTAEPKDSQTGFRTRYDGKLVSQILLPKDAVTEKVGGPGREFVVNGVNYPYDYSGKLKDCAETGWGRVEVSPGDGRTEDDFLNVMTVCDGSCARAEPARLLESEGFAGAQILDLAVFFSREDIRHEAFTLRTVSPVSRWVVTGLAGGDWKILSNGETVGTGYVSAESGVLSFSADRTEYTFVPGRSQKAPQK